MDLLVIQVILCGLITHGSVLGDNDVCPDGLVFDECNGDCLRSCGLLNPVCTEECVPGCVCPINAPVLLENGRCGIANDCEEPRCQGGQVYHRCPSCWTHCIDGEAATLCAMILECRGDCVCNETFPVDLGDGRCSRDCNHNINPCEFGSPYIDESGEEAYCGRGGSECPADHHCQVDATDRSAVCCPNPQCEGAQVYDPCPSCWADCFDGELVWACADIIECRGECVCPESMPINLGNGRCSSDCDRCEGELQYMDCQPGCSFSCSNPFPMCAFACEEGCYCPADRPFATEDNRCVPTLDDCPEMLCEGDLVYDFCGGCVASCNNRNPICTADCRPGCFCPRDTPILLSSGRCGTASDCEECEGDLVYDFCGGCVASCNNRNPICTADCRPGCVCPRDTPILLSSGRCGTASDCEACEENLVYDECNGGCRATCENPFPICTEQCQPGCVCPRDAPILLSSGRCGTASDCEECEGDLVYDFCGGCVASCNNRNPICTADCRPGCVCPRDTPILLSSGRCGTASDCEACEENLVYDECNGGCRATCENPFPICTEQCQPGCVCPRDAPILLSSGRCGTASDCEECEGDLVYDFCGGCVASCNNRNPICTADCRPGCVCPRDTPILLSSGRCGTASDCEACEENLVYDECNGGCRATCENPFPICTEQCQPGCVCPRDAPILLSSGRCGTARDCGVCEENLVYDLCSGGCMASCNNRNPVCTMDCRPGCICPTESPILLSSGRCGTADDCEVCEENLVYDECNGGCRATCRNPYPTCTEQCQPGCVCPRDAPILLSSGRCGTSSECEAEIECQGDLEFEACGGCQATCDDPTPACPRICHTGCFCPQTTPILLTDDQCGSVDRCYETEAIDFILNYETRDTFTIRVIRADNMDRLDAEQALYGYPGRALKPKVKRTSTAVLNITLGVANDSSVSRLATMKQLCVKTKDVAKITLDYYDISGERLNRKKVNPNRRNLAFFEREVEDVHTIIMSFKRSSGKKKIQIKDLRMPVDEDDCD